MLNVYLVRHACLNSILMKSPNWLKSRSYETKRPASQVATIPITIFFFKDNHFLLFGRWTSPVWFNDFKIKLNFVGVRNKNWHKRKSKKFMYWKICTQKYATIKIIFSWFFKINPLYQSTFKKLHKNSTIWCILISSVDPFLNHTVEFNVSCILERRWCN